MLKSDPSVNTILRDSYHPHPSVIPHHSFTLGIQCR